MFQHNMFCDCGFIHFMFQITAQNMFKKKQLFLTLELAHGENKAVEFMILLRDFQSCGKVIPKKFIVCMLYIHKQHRLSL